MAGSMPCLKGLGSTLKQNRHRDLPEAVRSFPLQGNHFFSPSSNKEQVVEKINKINKAREVYSTVSLNKVALYFQEYA